MRTSTAWTSALMIGASWPALGQEGQAPMSAIDWLSASVTVPATQDTGGLAVAIDEPPVTGPGGALPQPVLTTALDAPMPDAAGLIPPAVSGLPQNLWGPGLTREITDRLTQSHAGDLPALRQLFLTILLAEATPPVDADAQGALLQVRIDKLLTLGALEQTAALIQTAGTETPQMFRRAFDVALLTGAEDRACESMAKAPHLAPTVPARVFCLARSGDWDTAALTLHNATALGQLGPDQAHLLARFLDPELFESEPPPEPPNPVTPLDWKIFEAIGEPLGTESLPIAFSYAEISPRSGWKAQIEAAERLTRAGTIPPNVILGLYTERQPAASGGVWDRADAFQDFDAAMQSGDLARIGQTLPPAWARMREAELEVPFAMLYGNPLIDLPLQGEALLIAHEVALLSPQRDKAAQHMVPADVTETFLVGLAQGNLTGRVAPNSLGRAIAAAFTSPTPSTEAQSLLNDARLGEAILVAIDNIGRGVEGDLRGVTEGLSLLRLVGLEDVAQRTALELMLLERRG